MTDETATETPQTEDEDTAATRTRTRTRTARTPRTKADAPASSSPDDSDDSDDSGAATRDETANKTPAPRRRSTTRKAAGAAKAQPTDAGPTPAAGTEAAAPEVAEPEVAEPEAAEDAETEAAADQAEPDAGAAEAAEDAEGGEDDPGVIRRRRRRRGGRRGGRGRGGRGTRETPGAGEDAQVPTAEGAETDAEAAVAAAAAADEGEPSAKDALPATKRTRTRTRQTDTKDAGPAEDAEGDADDADDADAKPSAQSSKGAGAKGESAKSKEGSGHKSGGGAGSTRLQARNRGRSSGRGRGRGKGGRKPIGGVSEETRRAITEGPPRRMLVNAGSERTQIAVLEERTLVEHYVTRKEDVSYVGNIYLGRVQNVLPGMEAAFVDIGKGRNGVLYAGEVNYDEADLEGDLPRIEDHLKPGQTVLVQVTKDPMGTKGARLTQHLSIAGRYCVLAPGDGMLGISRKLTDDERDRLRKILKSIKPDGFGLIVRTAAEGATQEQLESDVSRLTRIWAQVQEKAKEVKALDPVYEEPHLVMRVIRDVFGTEFTDLVVDSAELAEQVRDYLSDVSPEMIDKVSVHEGEESIFDAYEVTNQVRRALEKKVWLKSGGYLIIEKTEAMWVIDVNTGKFVGDSNLEETVLKNNLEAADEIARQLRLRDMGGIIVIDFVDMLVPSNRDEVLKRFKRELARDKTKSRVMDISKLGLVQMTRKNVSQGLTETFTTTCDVCEGRGAKILDHAFH